MSSIAFQINRPTLQLGSRDPLVKDLQLRLSQQGRPLPITGVFDYETEIAVKYFQSQMFLNPDGVVGPLTWQALYAESPIQRPILTLGCSGEAVEAVQELLSIDLYYRGSVTGNFDSETAEAVQRFQKDQKLKVTGVVDAQTWQALSQI